VAAGAPERALDLFADLRMFGEARAFAAGLPPEARRSAPSGDAAAGADAPGALQAHAAAPLPGSTGAAGHGGPPREESGGAAALAAQLTAGPAAQAGAGAAQPAAQGLAAARGAAPRDALLDRLRLREAQWLEAGGGDLPAAAAAYAQARGRAAQGAARAQGAVVHAARGMHCNSAPRPALHVPSVARDQSCMHADAHVAAFTESICRCASQGCRQPPGATDALAGRLGLGYPTPACGRQAGVPEHGVQLLAGRGCWEALALLAGDLDTMADARALRAAGDALAGAGHDRAEAVLARLGDAKARRGAAAITALEWRCAGGV